MASPSAAVLWSRHPSTRRRVSGGGLRDVLAGCGQLPDWSITSPLEPAPAPILRACARTVEARRRCANRGRPAVDPAGAAGLRAALSWVGLAGILVATVTLGVDLVPRLCLCYPSPQPECSSRAARAARHRAGAAVVLGRQPLRLVGDLERRAPSRHWPPLVIAAQYAGHPLSTLQSVALLAAAFVVSYITYKLYENPLRHCRSLRRPRLALALWPASFAAVALAVALGTFLVVTPSAGPRPASPSTPSSSGLDSAPTPKPRTVRQALLEGVSPARLRQPVRRALAPPLGQLVNRRVPPGRVRGRQRCQTSASVCEALGT